VVRAVRSLVGNQQATEFWREMVRLHGAVSPTLQQMLMAMADMYDRPGGEDVTGLLVLLAAAEGLSLAELLHRLMGDGEPARSLIAAPRHDGLVCSFGAGRVRYRHNTSEPSAAARRGG
jgi:hypothetical protein